LRPGQKFRYITNLPYNSICPPTAYFPYGVALLEQPVYTEYPYANGADVDFVNALILYEYVCPDVKPVLLKLVVSGPVVFISVQAFVDEQLPAFLYT
jgi:hypothetical protein